MKMHRRGLSGGSAVLRVLLGGLGLVGILVSLGFAFLVGVVSQEKRSTKIEWLVLMAVVFASSVLCLWLALRQDKPRR